MSYYSHKLNSTHSHIIERTDPITGDAVKENDRVVFCAVCKSCFLEESWGYMKRRHCEQHQTLDAVPALSPTILVRKRSEKLLTILKESSVENSDYTVFSFILMAVCLTILFCIIYPDKFIFSVLWGGSISLGLFFITHVFFSKDSINFLMGNIKIKENKNIYLFEDRLETQKEIFYWGDIKQIKFERKMRNYRLNSLSTIPTLSLYFKDGDRQIKTLPTKDHTRIHLFLQQLAKISKFTEVYLYSEQLQEYQTIKQIKKNTKGNIIVGEPYKLYS
ncbi:hypothetical protein [Bernardetia sp. MNP-M8]|uniref:hypothetical protein n=1 Tax=Bernardetia sp. MNP-M8 TaxID=3127470 RepID=UPI0030CDE861